MSKPFSRHDDDDPVEGAPADTAGGPSSGYVALGDIALLSQAPLSSELDPPGGGGDAAPAASDAESESATSALWTASTRRKSEA